MSCTTLSIECFKAAYTANVGYDSLFCGLKVTCDSNVKYIRAPYVADFNGNTLMLHGWDKSETVIDDVTVTGLSVAQVKDLVATCCCGDDQHLIVNNTPVGYIPTTSGNTSNLNEVVIDSGGDTWIIDINGDARKFNKGTVTSFSAGNLSPLFTTGVATPTTTPALSFNLSNCNQYQVFGRVVAGTGAPSYVSLNPIAFNGLSLPNNQIAYGTGSGISSNGNLKYNGNSGLQIGGGTNTAYCAINIGNGVITNNSGFSFVLTENTANVISGLGNAVASFIIGSGNTITTGDITSSAYHNKIFGFNNSISAAPLKVAYYNFISGDNNIVTNGYYNNILGYNVTINGYYGCLALTDYGGSITLTANNQFTARFSGGYRFMKDGSTQWMAIAPTTGYVTINNIPTAASATDILVSNGGVVSTRTVASLGIPVITPAALTKTNDTNVTISLGGTPATALLQGVSLTMGWTGVLAISRGGTGLGSLGTAGQLLRTNSSATALEYFTPTFLTGNQTITLIGDITGSGATSIVTTIATNAVTTAKIANTAVTFAKIQNINTNRLLGRSSAGSGSVEEISIGSGLSLSGGTLSASGGGGSAVWKIQGGSTDATTNTDNIYHNARVRIGDSTVSSFQLSVVGQAYISSGAIINNSVYYSAYASDAVATELLGITISNLIKVGAPKSGSKSFDIYLPNYTSSRAADTMSAGDSFLFAASSGVMYKQGGQWVRNYGASVFTTADESHIADSTPRRVTFDSYVCNNDYGYFSYSFSSGDYKVAGATGQMFMVICTLEYTTSGTPTVTAQLRVGGATKETNISTSADGRKVMTIHTVTAGGGSGNFEVYLSVSGSAIALKKCRLSVMPLGAECP